MLVRLLAGALVVAVTLAACTAPTPPPPTRQPPTSAAATTPPPQVIGPGATPATSTTAPPTRATAEQVATARTAPVRKPAQVVRFVDGDTLRLRVDGREESVRLIGVNTPESVDPRRPIECLGKEASAKTAELLGGVQTVDPTQDARDAYARLLLYVWLPDGRLLNRELIASGYAHEYTFRTPYRFQTEFRPAQREAEAGRGLWAPGAYENQAPVSRSTPAPAQPAPPSTPKPTAASSSPGRGVPPLSKDDCPPSHPIKGNRGSRSTADWIYHPPGSRSYGATDPEECFATAADAEAAGYRAPRN